MSNPSPKELMYELISLKEEIDTLARSLTVQEGVFGEVSLSMPKLTPAELGLLRTVSWVYVLYNEAGKVNVEFLSEKLSAYGLNPQNKHTEHLRIVHDLRTYFQHNLNPNEPRSRQKQETCKQWFRTQCKTAVPAAEEEWKDCLTGLMNEVSDFLKTLSQCMRSIEQDESREQILREWKFRRIRYHPPQEFDRLIEEVTADMGQENIETVRLRNRFYDKWVKQLELLQGSYDFKVEGRKLIETALVSEMLLRLPIDGNDIMREFNLEPGPKVGELRKIAQSLYEADPSCSGDELLEKLRPKLEN
jgi:hypothetical protein